MVSGLIYIIFPEYDTKSPNSYAPVLGFVEYGVSLHSRDSQVKSDIEFRTWNGSIITYGLLLLIWHVSIVHIYFIR